MPMCFTLTDEQILIADSAAKFARTLRDKQRASEKDGPGDDLLRTYREMSFRAIDWPEAFGGSALGRATKLLAVEQLAFGDAAATLALDRVSFVCGPLLAIPAVAERVHTAVEQGGDDFTPVFYVDIDERITVKDGRAAGTIPYLPANRAGSLFLMQGSRLHCITTGIGLRSIPSGALEAMGSSEAQVDAQVQWSHELGEADALLVRGLWRLYLATALVGVSRASSEYARQYCLQRVAFGKKIAHHQAVAFILADMAVLVDASWLYVQEVAAAVDAGKDALHELQLAFLQAAECAAFVTPHGVQLLASAGYVKDHPVEKWMREGKALSLLAGGIDGAQLDANRALAREMEAA